MSEVGRSNAGPSNASGSAKRAAPLDAPRRDFSNQSTKVQQPKPQALPSRQGPSAILVNIRQKGNPILNNIRGVPWEWAETPADYVLGLTTCALFLSLKYHRLHPEYIYTRIKGLQHKFKLRIILTMVDIDNHEEALKELSKTSLINEVTLILCWSAAEGGRYLELFKSYEHAPPTSIKAHQSTSYSDRLVEFITVPRSVNKTDAVSLVSTFGSLRTAVNAQPEEIALVAGWGGKKVQRWCGSVREPFRVSKAAKRRIDREDSRPALSRDASRADEIEEDEAEPETVQERLHAPAEITSESDRQFADIQHEGQDDIDIMEVIGQAPASKPKPQGQPASRAKKDDQLSSGVAAALAKLRQG